MSVEYSTIEMRVYNDLMAATDGNGSVLRTRMANPAVEYDDPREGDPLWAGSVALLTDAQNVDNADRCLDFIMEPDHAAMISAFARHANGIAGSEAVMPEDRTTAPEVIVPKNFRARGRFIPTCSPQAQEYDPAVWTKLQKLAVATGGHCAPGRPCATFPPLTGLSAKAAAMLLDDPSACDLWRRES